ncbi:MAG: Gfo/Idh/MocA family oxidoreductase, partial [bacterium]|nr:Gfo/Idh/MocA family oxidoreductase [bacterium]
MPSTTRRDFVRGAATAGFAAAPAVRPAWGQGDKPSDRVNMAVVGFRGRGRAHYQEFANIPGVRVTHLADVDERLFPAAVDELEKISGHRPTAVVDMRKLLERDDIDAISVATPDHWHALHTIWGCQAEKDVYVEKPCSYTLLEGRRMVEAARKYKRMVQVGLNRRSDPRTRSAMRFLHDGALGPIYRAKAVIYRGRHSIGRVQ